MVFCTHRTLPAYRYAVAVDEVEWTKARNSLDFLDLADYSGTLFERYKKQFHSESNRAFQRSWIMAVGKVTMDDCRVLFERFRSDFSDSIFFHLSMENREPDWFGRNIFLEYFRRKIDLKRHGVRYLESGESAVNFLNLATLCGFHQWRETAIKPGSKYSCYSIAEILLERIYPSVLIGLFQTRQKHPLLAKKLWDMFGESPKTRSMLFEVIPDAQHLEFLLGVAKQNGFKFWSVQDGIPENFEQAIRWFVEHDRFHLVTVILRYGRIQPTLLGEEAGSMLGDCY